MISWPRSSPAHFDQAVRAYSTELFQYAAWLTRDKHRAEDVLQEAFTRAWKHWEQVDDESGRRSWLYAIVRNEFLREHAKTLVRAEEQETDAPIDLPDMTDFTLGVEVRDLLAKLPQQHLEPLLLQSLMGMSCEEIAAVLDLTPGATMTRLCRARSALLALCNAAGDAVAKPSLRLVQLGGTR